MPQNSWWKNIFAIVKKPAYLFSFLLGGIILMILFISLSIRSILAFSFQIPADSFGERVRLTLNAFTAVPLNLTALSILFISIVAFLTALNIALLVFFFRYRADFYRRSSLGFLGSVFGIIGIGCASCGSVILTSVIGLSATAAVTGFLPLGGAEFSVIAIGLLGYSIYSLSRQLSPEMILACERK